jgi:hypothetical protein
VLELELINADVIAAVGEVLLYVKEKLLTKLNLRKTCFENLHLGIVIQVRVGSRLSG